MTRRFLLGVLAMGYSRAVTAAVQLLLVPILALSWGLPLYGQWLMLASVPSFLAASDLGFGISAGMRIIAEVARGREDEALRTYRTARRIVGLASAAMLAAALAVIALLPDRMLAVTGAMGGADARVVLAVLATYGLLVVQSPLLAMIARAMGRTAQGIAIEGTMQLVEGLAAVAIALGGGGPLQVAMAYVVLRVAGLAAFLLYVRAIAPWLGGKARVSRARMREMWRPAIATMVFALSQAGYLQGSALAVGVAGGAAVVPLYTSLRTLARLGYQAAMMVAIPLMPEYAAMRARGEDRRSALIVGSVVAVVTTVGIGYALVLGVAGEPLLAAWTHGAIRPPHAMVVLMALTAAMTIVWSPLSDLLLAINRHEAFAYAYSICAAAAVALTLVLVRMVGVTGAAGASMALEVTMLVTVIASLRRYGGPVELRPAVIVTALAAALPNLARRRSRER